jgi:hypothetical protein
MKDDIDDVDMRRPPAKMDRGGGNGNNKYNLPASFF